MGSLIFMRTRRSLGKLALARPARDGNRASEGVLNPAIKVACWSLLSAVQSGWLTHERGSWRGNAEDQKPSGAKQTDRQRSRSIIPSLYRLLL
jgi:hypothetical protein